MKKAINLRMMIVASVAIILTAFLCTYCYYRVFYEEVMEDLKAYTRLLSDATFIDDDDEIKRYAAELTDASIRLTIIEKGGKVRFDNVIDAGELDNHGKREEIELAYKNGEGGSLRRSETLNITNFYYAVRLEDGTIVRTAKETQSIYMVFRHAFPLMFVLVIFLLIICYILSHFLTKSIVRPVEYMAENMLGNRGKTAYKIEDNDKKSDKEKTKKEYIYKDKDENNIENIKVYKELEPILTHIQLQHDDIIRNATRRRDFTANITHELKTPLTSISGYSELIENKMADSQDIIKFASEIHRNADRLLVLINDILRLAELDDTAGEMSFSPVNIYEIAKNCEAMLEPEAEKLNIKILVSGEDTIINANKTMMEELVYNLCDNAMRYNKPGGHVYIRVKDNELHVDDDGIGIPAKYRERIFERFFRVDKSRSKKTGGTGLGLAIVKHIVKFHHAKLTVTSKEGEGTSIIVKF